MSELQIIMKGASARGDTGKGVNNMKKIFFGIRVDLITETKEALKREAERKAEKEKPEKTAEEMAVEEAAKKKDAEILAFLEAFKRQAYQYDFVIFTGIDQGVLRLDSFLPKPAGVSYDSTSLSSISAEERAEIEAEMRKTENVEFFSSQKEAIDYMTSI